MKRNHININVLFDEMIEDVEYIEKRIKIAKIKNNHKDYFDSM